MSVQISRRTEQSTATQGTRKSLSKSRPDAWIRRSEERGRANFGWLDSRHSFSFGRYFDPRFMGFSDLRVINDDRVAPGAGFHPHGHADMEIISYILEGAIEHRDSMGNSFVVEAGEVQRMSAGSGIQHSEFNASNTDELRFLQIWIMPNVNGIAPSYQQARIEQTSALTPLVTPDGRDGSLMLHQDASIYRMQLRRQESVMLNMNNRVGYLHVIDGKVKAQDQLLLPGDAIAINRADKVCFTGQSENLEALWFDLLP